MKDKAARVVEKVKGKIAKFGLLKQLNSSIIGFIFITVYIYMYVNQRSWELRKYA